MRKINTRNFRLATRQTQREVNRRILLNLIREYEPISRAELARRMNVRRGAVTLLVRELISTGVVHETGAAAVVRGRRPTMLSVRTAGRLIIAADVRPLQTFLALADLGGRIVARETIETPESAERLPDLLTSGVERLLQRHVPGSSVATDCQALGLVVPGMIDRKSGRLIYAPRLGWRDVELRSLVSARLGLKAYIESAPIACALARLWLAPDETRGINSFAYVHISDGVGVGLVLNGEPVRGDTHSAGEFGHVTIEFQGPECVCGRRGCWEALTCNSTTVARYVARVTGGAKSANGRPRPGGISIAEVVRRAILGEEAAVETIVEAGRDIGRGLALVVGAFNPGRIYVGGEITAAWSLLERPIRDALAEGAITREAKETSVVPDGSPAEYRLQGAVALVTAPTFAAHAVG